MQTMFDWLFAHNLFIPTSPPFSFYQFTAWIPIAHLYCPYSWGFPNVWFLPSLPGSSGCKEQPRIWFSHCQAKPGPKARVPLHHQRSVANLISQPAPQKHAMRPSLRTPVPSITEQWKRSLLDLHLTQVMLWLSQSGFLINVRNKTRSVAVTQKAPPGSPVEVLIRGPSTLCSRVTLSHLCSSGPPCSHS